MSDDLVKRLRKTTQSGKPTHVSKADRLAAADRIEELIEERDRWKDRYRFISGEMDTVLAGRGDEYDRAEAAEAKLEKALDWLSKVRQYAISWDDRYLVERSDDILAELKGEDRG